MTARNMWCYSSAHGWFPIQASSRPTQLSEGRHSVPALLLAAWGAPEGWMFWLRPTTMISQGGMQCTQGRVWVLALSSLQRAGVQVARHSPHEAGGDVCAVMAQSGAAPGELLPEKTSETHLMRVVAACLPCRKYLNRL